MAIYSLSAQYICRGVGLRSAVAAAAYRAGERLCDRTSRTWDAERWHDYSRKRVVHSEILTPEGAPEWTQDRERLWNAVQTSANRSSSQVGVLARELRIALPRELKPEQRLELVRDYVQKQFVDRGMVADLSIHDEPGKDQPHAHVMLTVRSLGPEGFGKRCKEWDQKEQLLRWRSAWAQEANLALASEGHEARIDHRSYADRGIDLEAQPKLYRDVQWHKAALEDAAKVDAYVQRLESGQRGERHEEFWSVLARNGIRIERDPTIALTVLTENRATFTRDDLLRFLNGHTLDAQQLGRCEAAVMGHASVVRLGGDDRGRERFTTREQLAREKQLVRRGRDLAKALNHHVEAHLVDQALESGEFALNQEQTAAVRHVTEGTGAIAIVEGHAGTGKSTMLARAREAWEAQGFEVRGAALAAKAADGLSQSSGITSMTLARWEKLWEHGRSELTRNTVFVIDEAGMVGTEQLGRVMERIHDAGAKVVLVGDSLQLQAINAGAPLRKLREELGAATLRGIQRQREEWQRDASMYLAGQEVDLALKLYEEHGHVHELKLHSEARTALVEAWDRGRSEAPGRTSLLLAHERTDVRALNELARERMREQGALGEDHVMQTATGPRSFAVGDRLYFLKNDQNLEVINGTLATVVHIEATEMVVKLDSGRHVAFDAASYPHVDHGYAATIHKSQGDTVDRAYVLASKGFDQSLSYVALTRHRERAELFWARESFGTKERMVRALNRERLKDMALDYSDVPPLAPETSSPLAAQKPPPSAEKRAVEPRTELEARYLALCAEKRSAWRSELEQQASQAPVRPDQMYGTFPSLREAHARSEQARLAYTKALQSLEDFRSEHPLKTKYRMGAYVEREQQLLRAEKALNLAQQERSRITQELAPRAAQLASEHNLRIQDAHLKLKALNALSYRLQVAELVANINLRAANRGAANLLRMPTEQDASKTLHYERRAQLKGGLTVDILKDPSDGSLVVADVQPRTRAPVKGAWMRLSPGRLEGFSSPPLAHGLEREGPDRDPTGGRGGRGGHGGWER